MNAELTAGEIREIRRQYGLSQKSFALLLGIGPASMVRYEQGSKPSKANANLIRAARHPEFMRECFERDGLLLPETQRARASEVIYAVVSLEPDGDVVEVGGGGASAAGVEEMRELTLRQEMLNELAANIACDIMNYMIEQGIDSSDESDPIAALLRQVFEVKREITDPQRNDTSSLDGIGGYLRYTESYFKSLRKACSCGAGLNRHLPSSRASGDAT